GASFHLGTKNTLAYIARLPLIRKVMPTALLIATIRHPYDSLNSWANTFEHLRQAAVERQPFGCPDDLALTGWQRKALLAIADTDHLAVRRALWWRYLALQLEDAGDYVQLLRYEDFVEA
ncbi:sulfotransferase, partial [Pseudomonas aeruginosa]|nr:sulfotransferase [Pseudomonas aeruginosa]